MPRPNRHTRDDNSRSWTNRLKAGQVSVTESNGPGARILILILILDPSTTGPCSAEAGCAEELVKSGTAVMRASTDRAIRTGLPTPSAKF